MIIVYTDTAVKFSISMYCDYLTFQNKPEKCSLKTQEYFIINHEDIVALKIYKNGKTRRPKLQLHNTKLTQVTSEDK